MTEFQMESERELQCNRCRLRKHVIDPVTVRIRSLYFRSVSAEIHERVILVVFAVKMAIYWMK